MKSGWRDWHFGIHVSVQEFVCWVGVLFHTRVRASQDVLTPALTRHLLLLNAGELYRVRLERESRRADIERSKEKSKRESQQGSIRAVRGESEEGVRGMTSEQRKDGKEDKYQRLSYDRTLTGMSK